jgi:hypothetical protein
MNANSSNSSTIILNDCINTNQCEGINCRSCVPVLEKAIKKIIGKGISMAKAGRGGHFAEVRKKIFIRKYS